MIGTTPSPFLPVLSATSCSTQSPREDKASGRRSVSLSRPRRAAAAISAPSARPGFERGCAVRHASAILAVRERSISGSMPMSAAGTKPNSESAE